VLLTNGMVARLEDKKHLATSLHDGFEPENLLQLLHQHASGVMGPVGVIAMQAYFPMQATAQHMPGHLQWTGQPRPRPRLQMIMLVIFCIRLAGQPALRVAWAFSLRLHALRN
jgi:hypothetical protein